LESEFHWASLFPLIWLDCGCSHSKGERSQLPHTETWHIKPDCFNLWHAEWTSESPGKQIAYTKLSGSLSFSRLAEFDEYMTNLHIFNKGIDQAIAARDGRIYMLLTITIF
jgi:hypothetical protein